MEGIVEYLMQNLQKPYQRFDCSKFDNPVDEDSSTALEVWQSHCTHVSIRHIHDQSLVVPHRPLGGTIRPSVHIIRGRRIQSSSIC